MLPRNRMRTENALLSLDQIADLVKNKDNILQVLEIEGILIRILYTSSKYGYLPLFKTVSARRKEAA